MFAEQLKRTRQSRHYSQAEIASKLGVTQQAIAKWETGVSTPSPTSISKLSDILGISTDVLLKGAKDISPVGHDFLDAPAEYSIPAVGKIRPYGKSYIFEEQYGSAWAYVPNPNDYIYYILDDDAMAPRIMTGDTALIHYQQRLCDGDIGLFIYSPYPIGFIAQYKQIGSSIVLPFLILREKIS